MVDRAVRGGVAGDTGPGIVGGLDTIRVQRVTTQEQADGQGQQPRQLRLGGDGRGRRERCVVVVLDEHDEPPAGQARLAERVVVQVPETGGPGREVGERAGPLEQPEPGIALEPAGERGHGAGGVALRGERGDEGLDGMAEARVVPQDVGDASEQPVVHGSLRVRGNGASKVRRGGRAGNVAMRRDADGMGRVE